MVERQERWCRMKLSNLCLLNEKTLMIRGSISMNIKWGLYPWFIEHGTELIYPDDLENFRKEMNSCKVFQCIEEGNYITLKYNDRLYKVKDNLFRPVLVSKFDFGEEIEIVKNKEKGNYFAHTLNNTVVAPPRMLIAFLENNINADGSINIPKPLQPYMGGTEVLKPKK